MKIPLSYVVVAIVFIFFVWLRIKQFKAASKRREDVKNLTPDFFRKKEAKMPPKDYIKWLRMFYLTIGVEALERRSKGLKVAPETIKALILTEKEIENINARRGTQINLGEKISDKFKSKEAE